jgi:hypothetical protein
MFAWGLVALAVLVLIMLGFVPALVRLRIRILRWLHWNWAADLLERHFDRWVMFFRYILVAIAAALLYFGWASLGRAQQIEPDIDLFFDAASIDRDTATAAQAEIADGWRDGYSAMVVDLLDILQRTGFVDPRGFVQLAVLTQFLEKQTGQKFSSDIAAWRRWVWSLPYQPHSAYGEFKGLLYANLDPRFAEFFRPPVMSSIRLDEIQWGGVTVNGIPPLDHPELVAAEQAQYLEDGNIVFGFSINGDSRAYPKRILAWHELALDKVGGQELTIVYCTLCGTVIPFASEVGGELRTFGTSGLLYQSNKLMFDEQTKSLWSSLTGEPVVGPLVGSGIALTALPVVTTTWGAWRRRHPDTKVLSIDTGFARDYSEGAAYRNYFGTDNLMFDVSQRDARLPNKAEVLVLRSLEDAVGNAVPEMTPYAITADYLEARPVHHVTVDNQNLVVLTTESGANRVYASGSYRFAELTSDSRVTDTEGRSWTIEEAWLAADFDAGLRLPRVSAHRAFWFGWYAQHPDTILIR